MSTTTKFNTTREIVYCGETRDYALYLNGELVGFAHTYHEGEVALDALVYESLLASPLSEVEALAQEIADTHGCNLPDAIEIAGMKLEKVLRYAAEWDAWAASQMQQAA